MACTLNGDNKMEVVDSDEEYMDDPITLIDYEQYRFGMTAQGFDRFNGILPNKTQSYLSNHKRLFETFFNAHKCKPVNVQLVDCVKYRRYNKLKTNERRRTDDKNIKPPSKRVSVEASTSSKPFHQIVNTSERKYNLPVIKNVLSLNCNMYKNTLNNQYDCDDKTSLQNLIKLVNQHNSAQKIKETHISDKEANTDKSVNNMNKIIDPLNSINVKNNETTKKYNKRSDNSDDGYPKSTESKDHVNPKRVDNYDVNKQRTSFNCNVKHYYNKSDIDKKIPDYKKFTLLPFDYSSGSLNLAKPELPPPQPFSSVLSRNVKPDKNVYIPCLYLKSQRNTSEVRPFNRKMNGSGNKSKYEPDVVLNNDSSRSNWSKGYSPPILPIPTFEMLLD